MNGGAPYQVDVTLSTDDTLRFAVELEGVDGGAFPWADNTLEYAVSTDGGQVCRIAQGAGITVDPLTDQATILLPSLVAPGVYSHACRTIANADLKPTLLFDGALTILRGSF